MSNVLNQTGKKSTIVADLFLPKMTLTLSFSNGNEIIIDANALSPEIRDMALLHGLKQKLVDGAALPHNLETGRAATVDDKYNAVKKIADRLLSSDGKWNEGRAAGTVEKGNVGNILIRAVMKMTGRDESYTRQWLESKTKEQRAALKKNPKIVQIIAELSAATVSNGVNTDELLSELGMSDEGDDSAGNGAALIDEPVAVKAPNTRTSKRRLVSTTAE